MKYFNKYAGVIAETIATFAIIAGILYMAAEINSMSTTITNNKKERNEAIAALNVRLDKLEKKEDLMIADIQALKKAVAENHPSTVN